MWSGEWSAEWSGEGVQHALGATTGVMFTDVMLKHEMFTDIMFKDA